MIQIKESKMNMFEIMQSSQISDLTKNNNLRSHNELNHNPKLYANFPIKFEYPNIHYADDDKRLNGFKNKSSRNHLNNNLDNATSKNILPQLAIFKTNIRVGNSKDKISKQMLKISDKISNQSVEKRILFNFKNRSISSPLYKSPEIQKKAY